MATTLQKKQATSSIAPQTDSLFEKGWAKPQPFFVPTAALCNEYPHHTKLIQ
jgi:hypothetical protein